MLGQSEARILIYYDFEFGNHFQSLDLGDRQIAYPGSWHQCST